MKEAGFSEMLVTTYMTINSHNPEDQTKSWQILVTQHKFEVWKQIAMILLKSLHKHQHFIFLHIKHIKYVLDEDKFLNI
jgi:hypothetical protein